MAARARSTWGLAAVACAWRWPINEPETSAAPHAHATRRFIAIPLLWVLILLARIRELELAPRCIGVARPPCGRRSALFLRPEDCPRERPAQEGGVFQRNHDSHVLIVDEVIALGDLLSN